MLRFAVRNLLSRPARSVLSLLGLTVAIVGMVGLFSVAEGIDATVEETFERIPGLIVMQRGAPIPLFSRVPKSWAKEIEEVPGVNVVSAEIWVRVNVINGKKIVSPPRFLFGADIESHQELIYSVYADALVEGRYLNESDQGKYHTVVSRQIAEEFDAGVGDKLTVNGVDFEIVGIYHCGSLLLDIAIIVDQPIVRQMSLFDPDVVCSFYVEPTGEIPNEKLVEWIREMFRGRDLASWQPSSLVFGGSSGSASGGSSTSSTASTRNRMSTSMPSGNPLVDLVRTADRQLKSLSGTASDKPEAGRAEDQAADGGKADSETAEGEKTDGKKPGDEMAESGVAGQPGENTLAEATEDDEADNPLEVRTAADWAERFDDFSSDLDIFLTIMTSIGLTIAVLSIINTMLMSVSERIIEFGILKANGWSRSDVMKLITFESGVLGLAGGVCGALLGWIGTLVINANWPEHIRLLASPGLLAFSIFFATVMGMAGGLYPALWATRMMPMDAIRRG